MIRVKVARSAGTRMFRRNTGIASVILIFQGDEAELAEFIEMGTEDREAQAVIVAKKILARIEGNG